ncbi:MAG: VWA domain-containing protein [Candidatus Caldarchaeum sp.]
MNKIMENFTLILLLPAFALLALLSLELLLQAKAPVFLTTTLPLSPSPAMTQKDKLKRSLRILLFSYVLYYLLLSAFSGGLQLCPLKPTLILLLDTSISMCANDYSPNRFTHTLHLAKKILAQTSYEQIAIYTFNKNIAPLIPLTSKEKARQQLESFSIDNFRFDEGTAIGRALLTALKDLNQIEEMSMEEQNFVALSRLKRSSMETNTLPQQPQLWTPPQQPPLWLFLVISDGMNNTGVSPKDVLPLFTPPHRAALLLLLPPLERSKQLNCPSHTLPENYQHNFSLEEEPLNSDARRLSIQLDELEKVISGNINLSMLCPSRKEQTPQHVIPLLIIALLMTLITTDRIPPRLEGKNAPPEDENQEDEDPHR